MFLAGFCHEAFSFLVCDIAIGCVEGSSTGLRKHVATLTPELVKYEEERSRPETIKKSRACLGAQLTICAQK